MYRLCNDFQFYMPIIIALWIIFSTFSLLPTRQKESSSNNATFWYGLAMKNVSFINHNFMVSYLLLLEVLLTGTEINNISLMNESFQIHKTKHICTNKSKMEA